MNRLTSSICAIATMGLGLLGLHTNTEYSGWVLFVGILWAFCS